ncbi:MAG: hypothetical protein ACJAX4_001895 [Clostridium sp.]|jgi:hypothetical protein
MSSYASFLIYITDHSQFYECFNGIAVKTGADVFNKLKIENNTKTVNDLKNTIPNTQESLSYLLDDNGLKNIFDYSFHTTSNSSQTIIMVLSKSRSYTLSSFEKKFSCTVLQYAMEQSPSPSLKA